MNGEINIRLADEITKFQDFKKFMAKNIYKKIKKFLLFPMDNLHMREIVLASALREYYPITQKAFLICDQERSEKTILSK